MVENLVLKRLSTETLDEFLAYFDHRAFLNDSNWDGCYCQFYLGTEDNSELPIEQKKQENRALACSRVETGKMDGYLLFDGEQVIGWCAAGSSLLYPAFPEATETLARVLCFNIDPERRGMGLATRLLELVLADLTERGFDAVEAAPASGEISEKTYRGSLKMFIDQGFEPVVDLGNGFSLVRKHLT